jgi:hypothetical protein
LTAYQTVYKSVSRHSGESRNPVISDSNIWSGLRFLPE